ncbi:MULTISPECIES: dephospho-CoA kinase [Bartonella]|uniref:dephospho-CoA kinase n=1 Tax=Bartonella TaxID=773 RepID=UPI0018DBE790|nr:MULTISPECIES: dephospho-CoA kinase [Bartonella]MBH9995497.1 dephospho-CoA kinase [Bartonella sp. P0291]MBH9996159.1 dephospho-CoA kinase [Bartonella sp. M0192]MBH9998320.1 dephospho-CoA kinase [Bartonella sp. M0191]MBI0009082.1 dephospho-CoA kinase [Bartonella sp. M0193]MBI0009610.1 dephospho-CoA kinase [Bartonella sp. M0176]
MIILGLTGSIGMGKTTTAGFFEEAGVPVYNADRAVHELYESKPVIEDLSRIFPDCLTDGRIDRSKLSKTIVKDPSKLVLLEKFIHPLVRKKEKDFVKMHRDRGDPLVVLDIPLLFETGPEGRVDKIAVVSAPTEIQRQRVLARSGWDDEKLNRILSRQISDEEKRRRADFVIDTGKSLDDAREQVKHLISRLTLK